MRIFGIIISKYLKTKDVEESFSDFENFVANQEVAPKDDLAVDLLIKIFQTLSPEVPVNESKYCL